MATEGVHQDAVKTYPLWHLQQRRHPHAKAGLRLKCVYCSYRGANKSMHMSSRAVCTLTPRLTSPSKNTPNCNEKIAKYQEGIISTSSAGTLYFAPEADIASHTANATSSPARKMWSCVQFFRHPAHHQTYVLNTLRGGRRPYMLFAETDEKTKPGRPTASIYAYNGRLIESPRRQGRATMHVRNILPRP